MVLGRILTLIIRSEYLPIETVNRCRLLCEAVEKYYNKKLELEMKSFTSGLETPFSVNSEQGPFQCTGEGRLYKRYLKNKEKIENQVQYFNDFKNRFPECNDAPVELIKSEIEEISNNLP